MATLSDNNRGVTAATVPSAQLYWPLPTRSRIVRTVGSRSFGAPRGDTYRKVNGVITKVAEGTRYHAGVDLYGALGDIIVAPQDCEIINFYHFYRGTYSIIVKTSEQVLNIGEVREDSLSYLGHKSPIVRIKPTGKTYRDPLDSNAPRVIEEICSAGSFVAAGEPLAVVGKMHRSSMLHFEVYASGTTRNKRWYRSGSAPSDLRDPTPYLVACKEEFAAKVVEDDNTLAAIESTSEISRVPQCSA